MTRAELIKSKEFWQETVAIKLERFFKHGNAIKMAKRVIDEHFMSLIAELTALESKEEAVAYNIGTQWKDSTESLNKESAKRHQCPYDISCHCVMNEGCAGCETWAKYQAGETIPANLIRLQSVDQPGTAEEILAKHYPIEIAEIDDTKKDIIEAMEEYAQSRPVASVS